MANSQTNIVIDHLRRAVVAGREPDLTDGQLLECFLSRRDEAAVTTLVRRHGPMVWATCCRLLSNHHDAEDAFQATFLVLVRKAASIMPRDMVANWLYGVAHQTALKARALAATRQAREKQVHEMPESEAGAEPDLWHDLQTVLDQELSRLPDKYRVAVALCDLEGRCRKDAARQLKIPEGTLSSRLTTARKMLAKRLARHGLVVSAVALATVLSQHALSASVPTSVLSSTIKAASQFVLGQTAAGVGVKASVATLAKGMLKAMLLKKIKAVTVAVLILIVACLGAAVVTHRALGGQTNGRERPPTKPDQKQVEPGPSGEVSKAQQPDEALRLQIDKVLKAYGGEERLRRLNVFSEKIKSVEAFGSTSTSEYFVQLPDKLRIVTERQEDGKNETLLVVWNGTQQWKTKDGVQIEPEHPLGYWNDFVKFFGPRAILRLKDPQCRVRLLPQGDQPTSSFGFGVHKGPMSSDLSLFLHFDAQTGLLLKEENNHDDSEMVYGDYKTFDGFPVAQKLTRSVKTRTVESLLTAKSQVIDFRVKDEFDAKLFQMP